MSDSKEEEHHEPQPEDDTIESKLNAALGKIEDLEGKVTSLIAGQESLIARMDTMVSTAADNVLPENPESEVLEDVTVEPEHQTIFDDSSVQKKPRKERKRWGGVF